MTKHLWEYDHDYYGPQGDYYANGYARSELTQVHASFEEFVAEWGAHDVGGMNVLWRWDWLDYENDPKYSGDWPDMLEDDPDAPEQQLFLFYIHPRKAFMTQQRINISKSDEEAVIEWLTPHLAYLQELWAPIAVTK